MLVAMDRSGLKGFIAELERIQDEGSEISRVVLSGVTHVFAIGADEARVEIVSPTLVHWRLSRAKLNDLTENLASLEAANKPCHDYVDITGDANTLVLSVDEGY